MLDGILAARPRGFSLAARYVAFALLASTLNLLVQMAVMGLYHGPWALLLAMAAGTAAGLAPKFLLDKYWIFYDRAPGRLRGLRQFILYGLLSVVTTLLFWAFEITFHWLGDGGPLRYVGAALGLGLGYWAKYHLDRHMVFGRA
ncbi:GtrA family protein [Roseomonas sp. SSH11]|uniref:GtrA family protein n=1 Tax=Pararoseomonas baculiformis TaxID=2820812 RepID=A0ABS4ABH1_9PROT|nr:GtrA family protein [Pararoseomonas baculiformis]MBP0443890.1 GtrA family protein [Pararoseomonas baculiformis]